MVSYSIKLTPEEGLQLVRLLDYSIESCEVIKKSEQRFDTLCRSECYVQWNALRRKVCDVFGGGL